MWQQLNLIAFKGNLHWKFKLIGIEEILNFPNFDLPFTALKLFNFPYKKTYQISLKWSLKILPLSSKKVNIYILYSIITRQPTTKKVFFMFQWLINFSLIFLFSSFSVDDRKSRKRSGGEIDFLWGLENSILRKFKGFIGREIHVLLF